MGSGYSIECTSAEIRANYLNGRPTIKACIKACLLRFCKNWRQTPLALSKRVF